MWNAAFLVSGGKTIGHYDKIRLVPFGEYVPLRKMLFFAEKLVHAVGEFEFGTNDTPLRGKLRATARRSATRSSIRRSRARRCVHGADVLVTITNDAWYDGTSAPRQHLNQARLRAVEDDRYLLRAGNDRHLGAGSIRRGGSCSEMPMGRAGIIYARFAAERRR